MSKRISSSKKETDFSNSHQLTFNLIKSIQDLGKIHQKFLDNMEKCQQFVQELKEDLELHITTKQKEFKEMEDDFERSKRSHQISLEQELKAFGKQKATEFLAQSGEIPVSSDEYKKTLEEHEMLKSTWKADMTRIEKEERDKYTRRLAQQTRTMELEYKAKDAERNAQLSQKAEEIKVLRKVIDDLKLDLEKQRELTRHVAESARPQMIPSYREK